MRMTTHQTPSRCWLSLMSTAGGCGLRVLESRRNGSPYSVGKDRRRTATKEGFSWEKMAECLVADGPRVRLREVRKCRER